MKKIFLVVVVVGLLVVGSASCFAGNCDYCVCKGDDTANSCTVCCKDAQKLGLNPTKLELRISNDGRSIVDQDGKEVARFTKGTKVQMATKGIKANNQKMQGCWHCYPVCVVWEGKRCVQWMRTCDWDFDCK